MDNEKNRTRQLQAMLLAEIRTGQAPFDSLLVFDLVRLTRNVTLFEEITQQGMA